MLVIVSCDACGSPFIGRNRVAGTGVVTAEDVRDVSGTPCPSCGAMERTIIDPRYEWLRDGTVSINTAFGSDYSPAALRELRRLVEEARAGRGEVEEVAAELERRGGELASLAGWLRVQENRAEAYRLLELPLIVLAILLK